MIHCIRVGNVRLGTDYSINCFRLLKVSQIGPDFTSFISLGLGQRKYIYHKQLISYSRK